ncbi:hypothetical protein BGX30_007507 [Mortierella sp. GBA39]|nr:hypothetical protein BGX30_007507 [Mortierella sp. GBA39]
MRVRLCIPSVVVESTLPVHTHAPEPTVFLHDPASSQTAVPTTSALKSSSISTTAHPLRAIEHELSQEQEEEQEEEDQNIEQLKKKLAQDITFSSSTATALAATVTTTSPPPIVTRTARFAEEEQIDDDMDRRQQGRGRQGNDENIALDQLSSLTPPTSSALRRGYVSTPSSPISSPTTTLYPPPLPIPSSNSSSPRGVSFQSAPLKRSSTVTRHGRSSSSSAAATGVRFQRGLGSPSIGASEEEDEDSLESGYPTFASYRQAQHTHFDAFAQRMRRTLETAAATNAAAATAEVSSPSPLYEQSIPNPTAETLEIPHTSDTSTRQQPSSQPPKYN